MKLTAFERIQALQLIVKLQGNVLMLRTLSSMRKKLGISPEEMTEFGMTVKDGVLVANEEGKFWNAKGDEKRSIKLELVERSVLRDILRKLDDSQALNQEQLSLYEAAFADDEPEDPPGIGSNP